MIDYEIFVIRYLQMTLAAVLAAEFARAIFVRRR